MTWQPKVVALDIDGTLIDWDSVVANNQQIADPVHEAVRRAYDAGAHIVLSSGRSTHGMTPVADLLGIPDAGDRCWIVSSNGAIVVKYPPSEVVHRVTFDASAAVRGVLAEHPQALVAVEDEGVGYRINRPFPGRELDGDMTLTDVEDLISEPVSRVIIRDPEATVEDFEALGKRLGLHGTDYTVGWSAWLDLAPEGVSKASGLEHVVDQLGLTAADVLAIGDGNNDKEMLAWAGLGVAMGQGSDRAKAAADQVTASVAEHGAAIELNKWF